ncbi:MAG: YggT family protein [Acidimicrobiales bacterium]|jgi:YggT family protein
MIFLVSLLRLVSFIFLARVILSWFRPSPGSPIYPIVDVIERITEPVLAPIRRVLPPMGGFDLSSMIVLIGINWILIPVVRGLA